MSTEIKLNELPDLKLNKLFNPASLSEADIQGMVSTLKSGKVMDQLGALLEELPEQSHFLLENIQSDPQFESNPTISSELKPAPQD